MKAEVEVNNRMLRQTRLMRALQKAGFPICGDTAMLGDPCDVWSTSRDYTTFVCPWEAMGGHVDRSCSEALATNGSQQVEHDCAFQHIHAVNFLPYLESGEGCCKSIATRMVALYAEVQAMEKAISLKFMDLAGAELSAKRSAKALPSSAEAVRAAKYYQPSENKMDNAQKVQRIAAGLYAAKTLQGAFKKGNVGAQVCDFDSFCCSMKDQSSSPTSVQQEAEDYTARVQRAILLCAALDMLYPRKDTWSVQQTSYDSPHWLDAQQKKIFESFVKASPFAPPDAKTAALQIQRRCSGL